jgi:filamentous hemagglutinin family protein
VACRLVAVLILLLWSAHPGFALPLGQQVVSGQADFSARGNSLAVTNSPNAIIHWQGFSISAGEAVRFIQQSASSSVLNRVVGQDPSRIFGLLQSNGRVFLINPNGILFGPGAVIDVNGLFASTLDISNQDFLAARYRFSAGAVAGPIENQGTITTPEGGKVYLIAPDIANSGIIHSPKGEVLLAAGRSVQLVDSLDPDIAVVVSAPQDRVENIGQILSQSGRVGIYGGLIFQKGVVSADSAAVGENGRIVLRASREIALEAGSVTSANGPDGGQITVQSETGTARVAGTVAAAGSEGQGGEIRILGKGVELTGEARVDASGGSGGGAVLIGGDYQGKNPDIQNAETTYVGQNVVIKADALDSGNGGKVVLWADDRTEFHGNISARGGPSGGDGGNVEVSGKRTLLYRGLTDLRAPKGKTGSLLLDPTNFWILPLDGDITGADLGTQLDAANVTIQTEALGAQNGDINVDDTVTWTSANRLTLSAHDNIFVNNVLTNSGGGSLVLRADSDGSGGGTVYFNPSSMVNMTGGGGGSVSIYYNPADYLAATYSADVSGFNAKVTAGTRAYYMLVNDVFDLQAMNTNLAGRYALGTDIDASATTGWNAGLGFDPIGNYVAGQEFTGVFDGLGHTITGLFINRGGESFVGLFGSATDAVAATIANVGLVNVNITGGFQTGGLLGRVSGTVSNCYVTGTVTGTGNTVGGLAGLSAGSISNSYSTANVSGASFVGGLVGANYQPSASITNSYSTGSVTATGQKGGLSGYNYSGGPITGSYWDTDTSGLLTSYGGTGKTTAEMQDQATFVGWDFIPPATNTWSISAGQYPLINGLYAIVGLPDFIPQTPPAPPTPTPTAASTEALAIADGGTVVALDSATGSAALNILDERSSEEQEGAEDEKRKTKEGGEQTYEIPRGAKVKNYCN